MLLPFIFSSHTAQKRGKDMFFDFYIDIERRKKKVKED